nr:hypothetical protein [uncultured Rhodopila sp.]
MDVNEPAVLAHPPAVATRPLTVADYHKTGEFSPTPIDAEARSQARAGDCHDAASPGFREGNSIHQRVDTKFFRLFLRILPA